MPSILRLAVAAGLSFAVVPAAAAEETKRRFDVLFAEAVSEERTAQVAGTYPARSEVLVKLANNNQYAVPVVPGSDLSIWRQNQVVTLTITQGLMTALQHSDAEPGVSFSILNETDEIEGIPDDLVVREVTLVSEIKSVNRDTGAVTFLAPSGYERTAVLSDPSIVKDLAIEPGERFSMTYFDAIDIHAR